MHLAAGGATDPGPRHINQDAFFIDLDLGLLLIADGMGGHKAGEVASRMAVDAVVDFIRTTATGRDITWPFPYDPERSRGVNRLDAALRLANRRVFDAGEQSREHASMGTTLVALLVQNENVVVAHVGDSRAYVLRQGELLQLTRDHTLLNEVGEFAGPHHPLRHVLTSGIGMGSDVVPAIAEQGLFAGERWLMCTDGVHGFLDVRALRGVLDAASAQNAADEAVRVALAAGSSDNVTAVVMNVD